MGWKGSTATPGRIFSRAVDTIVRQAPCEVVLVRLNRQSTFNRWLVPVVGGTNAQKAMQLLPALISLSSTPEVKICQVFNPTELPDITKLEQSVSFLKPRIKAKVVAAPVFASSVPEAIISLAQQDQCDVIVVGASREGLLQQRIQENIPETIACQSDCTVMLVRST